MSLGRSPSPEKNEGAVPERRYVWRAVNLQATKLIDISLKTLSIGARQEATSAALYGELPQGFWCSNLYIQRLYLKSLDRTSRGFFPCHLRRTTTKVRKDVAEVKPTITRTLVVRFRILIQYGSYSDRRGDSIHSDTPG